MIDTTVPPKVRLSHTESRVHRSASVSQTYVTTDGASLLRSMRQGIEHEHEIRVGESPFVANNHEAFAAIDHVTSLDKMRDLVDQLEALERMLSLNGGTLTISVEVDQ